MSTDSTTCLRIRQSLFQSNFFSNPQRLNVLTNHVRLYEQKPTFSYLYILLVKLTNNFFAVSSHTPHYSPCSMQLITQTTSCTPREHGNEAFFGLSLWATTFFVSFSDNVFSEQSKASEAKRLVNTNPTQTMSLRLCILGLFA